MDKKPNLDELICNLEENIELSGRGANVGEEMCAVVAAEIIIIVAAL